jgi:hypothetical protein
MSYERQETIEACNTELSNACDDFIEAHKEAKDAVDHLKVCRERCALLMKQAGLGDRQQIRHDGKIIMLKEGKVIEDTVVLKKDKEE